MSQTYEFLKTCGSFFLLTQNGNAPAGRPFGAVMESEGKLYICTASHKAVYAQMKKNPQVQIVALKPGGRDWLRLDARAAECSDVTMKQRMFSVCPILQKRYTGENDPAFALFSLEEADAWVHTDSGTVKLDG